MALQSAVAERWREVTGCDVLQGYGLTETSPVLTFEPVGKAREGTIGIPVPSTEVACFDDDGNKLPQGEVGEIAARGPQIMKGYWKKPEETEDWPTKPKTLAKSGTPRRRNGFSTSWTKNGNSCWKKKRP